MMIHFGEHQAVTNENLLETPLHTLHLELGAKMVPFAGYSMPVQYPSGVMKEHKHTREKAGLFDVSHMGQIRIKGASAAEIMESLVPVDVIGLQAGKQRYAMFTNENGGILDDLMISNAGDHLFVVVNAACKTQDIALLQQAFANECEVEVITEQALIALQGPAAAAVLSEFLPQAGDMHFMDCQAAKLAGQDCFISRSGYTGEDGYEISLPAAAAESFCRELLQHEAVAPIGLGARDSLRLEAGLCLYGHDLNTTTTPLEANLQWAIQKVRRSGGERAGGFPGADRILQQFESGVTRKRVGILPQGRAPLREGVTLHDPAGKEVGEICSGGFGPSFGAPVAMAYVNSEHAKIDTELQAQLRGKSIPVKVAKMPFVPQRYYRG